MFSTTTTSMQGFFKTAVTSTTSRYTNNNNNNNNNNLNEDIHKYNKESSSGIDMMGPPQLATTVATTAHHSILPGSMNLFAQYDSKANAKTIHGLTEIDIKMVINDTESFHIIQEQLRDRNAQTNALVKHIGIELIRERYNVMKRQQQQIEQQKRMEDRKLQIARELTEARIKARQALNLTISKRTSSIDDDDNNDNIDETKEDRNVYDNDIDAATVNNNNSPTSVMATLSIDESKINTFKGGLLNDEYDSEDGDIQEVIEE
jgi:hypothetical protein